MKKYYMSFVDFSEISNVTADEEQLKKSRDRMAELGLLTEKGNQQYSAFCVEPLFRQIEKEAV